MKQDKLIKLENKINNDYKNIVGITVLKDGKIDLIAGDNAIGDEDGGRLRMEADGVVHLYADSLRIHDAGSSGSRREYLKTAIRIG